MATLTNKQPGLDRQAIAAIFAGTLLLAISFLKNYGHGALLHFHNLALDEQIGGSLHAAALAALVSDAELATRLRNRARNQDDRSRHRKARQVNLQTRCAIAQSRFQLADIVFKRLQLNESLAALLETLQTRSTE
jgi:hypothetical protein